MSGSRTDIFNPNTTPAMSENTPASNGGPNADDRNVPRSRTVVPVSFKLNLIAEVKKHEYLWQDRKQRKNIDLLNDAWLRIRRALRIKKTGFCEKQWNLLCHGYRSHINRGTPMHVDLIREMAFMTPQLKKASSDNEQSDVELAESESPVRPKAQTPKPKKVAKHDSQSEAETDDYKASVAILKLLFANMSQDLMRPVKCQLVESLINIMPAIEAKISDHAKKQIATCGDMNRIDWSTLDVPPEVSKAVWDYKVMKALSNI